MGTYIPSASNPLVNRPRAHTHTSVDPGSPATLVPPSLAPSIRPPVRAQGPPLGHVGQRTVSASVMDGANRGFAVPPSPGIATPMMTLPPPPPGGPPNGHGASHLLPPPPPPPLKDHPSQSQTWNSWGKAHGGPQWTQGAQYQPQQQVAQQPQQHLQTQVPYIPHQTPTTHHPPTYNFQQSVNQRPQDLDISSERNLWQDSDMDYLLNPRSILAANQTATLSRQANAPLQSPSITTGVQPIFPDHGLFWTPDRVIAWLDRNGFSREWQEAFKNLNIHGTDFLEIGQRYSAQLHQAVLPEVLRLCGPNADPEREHKAGKRIKSLVGGMVKLGANAQTPAAVPMSPGYFDESPGKSFLKGSGRQAPSNTNRRPTLSEMYESDPRMSAELQPRAASDQQAPTRRSDYSKATMGSIANAKGASPSNSVTSLHQGVTSQGPYGPPTSRPALQDSPQSSPSPSQQPMPGRHAKTNSQESIASSIHKDVSRWTNIDTQKAVDTKVRNNGRPSTSHEKEFSSKFSGGKEIGRAHV